MHGNLKKVPKFSHSHITKSKVRNDETTRIDIIDMETNSLEIKLNHMNNLTIRFGELPIRLGVFKFNFRGP